MNLKERIKNGNLELNAITNLNSMFVIAIKGKEIGTAIIKSIGPDMIRIYRGFGKEVAEFKPENIDRKYKDIEGIKEVFIAELDKEGNVLDSITFQGKIDKYYDAQLNNITLESAIITVIKHTF